MPLPDNLLDKIAAQYGYGLCEGFTSTNSKELEREINKALGVLIEDGPFAYSIWLESKLESKNENPHKLMITKSLEILKTGISLTTKSNLREAILTDISSDLNKLFLTKQVLERMLVYARYRAKAIQKE
jgi:hypothetical protein